LPHAHHVLTKFSKKNYLQCYT